MNETIAEWVIEFLLRNRIDDKIINGVISSFPTVTNDYRLKKTMLLRRIETETSNGCISDNLLELIEIIDELDHEKGKTTSNLMKEAYCLVAVDCTVRFLVDNVEENGKYMEMIEIVWRNRVCKAERLVSEMSKRWLDDIELAVKDSSVYDKIWLRNTRNEALKGVKDYLKEAWECLGPPFLELVVEKAVNESVAGVGVVCDGNPCRELVVVKGTQKGQVPITEKHETIKSRRRRCVKLSDTDKDDKDNSGDASTEMVREGVAASKVGRAKKAKLTGTDKDDRNKSDYGNPEMVRLGVAASKVGKAKKALRSSSTELPALDDHLSDDLVAAQPLSSAEPRGNTGVVEANQIGPEILESPEVMRVKRALKDNTRELHAAVSDPLPEALRTAQTLVSLMATNNLETTIQNQTGSNISIIPENDGMHKSQEMAQTTITGMMEDAGESKQAETERGAVKGLNENEVSENAKQDVLGEDSRENVILDQGTPKKSRKRSLMEPNGTSRNYQWDDEIENPSSGSPSRPNLPSPKALRSCSPLKIPEYRNVQRRRERKMWTPLEEDTLREGVQKYGRGNWKAILIDVKYGEVFQGRTEVDLKDKWRNLTRYSSQ